MGYTGKVSKYRRNENTQVEEAYRVLQVGFEMIDIIKNVRESATDPNLKTLDMRIVIHTGKITGGIIGTKVVRYDIFGNDVLIANKMESNGVDSQVVISESTFNLLNKN
jgi:class 3 adenylate cyclase